MRLIEDGRAPNPRRVRVFLAEKGVEVERVQIDINHKDHLTDAFRAKNSLQRIPVLELDDGTTLSESMAICRYFEETVPEPPLFGTTALEKAQIEMWSRRAELNLFMQIAQGFRHTHPAMSEMEVPQINEWGLANQDKIDGTLRIFDDALRQDPFIAGNRFSVADITLLVAIDFMRVLKRSVPDDMTGLHRWHEEVKARPSAAA